MILYFSGTGNSRHVATELSRLLGPVGRPCKMMTPGMEIDGKCPWIVFVFPIYSWGLPPYVQRCVETLTWPKSFNSKATFMVATCGDDAGLADRQFASMAKRRGWHFEGAATVQMPNNYVCMKGFDTDPAGVEAAKLKGCGKQISAVADWIMHRAPAPGYLKGNWAWVKSRIIYPWFKRHAMDPAKFRATDACVGCGLCARSCPLGNISMNGKRPSWGGDCAFCLGCYHVCPHHAVDWNNKTANKGQYLYHET